MGLRDEERVIEGNPGHVRNKDGRVFIATPMLLSRLDMTPLYDYKPPAAKRTEAEKPPMTKAFKLSKATKQQIVTKALQDFGEQLSVDSSAKKLRAQFKELMDASNNDSK